MPLPARQEGSLIVQYCHQRSLFYGLADCTSNWCCVILGD